MKKKELFIYLFYSFLGFLVLYFGGLDQEKYFIQMMNEGYNNVFDAFVLLYSALSTGYFTFYCLLMAGCINSFMYLYEKNNGFGNISIVRQGYYNYLLKHIKKSIFSCSSVIIVSILIYFLYSWFKWGISSFDYVSIGATEWVYTKPYTWLLIQLFTYSVFTVIFSILNIGISKYLNKHILLYLLPLIVYILILTLLNVINSISRVIDFNFQWAFVLFPLNLTSILSNQVGIYEISIYLGGLFFYLFIDFALLYNLYNSDKRTYINS